MNHKLLVLCISISLLSINLAITQAAQTDCPTSDATSRNRALFTGIANEGGDHLETTHSRGRTPPLRRSNLLLQRNRIIGEVPNSRYRSVA